MDLQEANEHMFTRDPRGKPLIIERAEGIYLYDSRGYEYMDGSGGAMVVNVGHGRAAVADAVAATMARVNYVLPVFAHEERVELAKRIRALTPGALDRIWFGSGGSESVEAALKFAYQYQTVRGRPEKHKMLSRRISYHGNTILTLSVGHTQARRTVYAPLLQKGYHVAEAVCYRCPFDAMYPDCGLACAEDLEARILAEGPDTVAAFLAEPVVAVAAGVAPPPADYFARIREICDTYDVLLVFDEVVTGFGRLGRNFGADYFDVVPDLLVFGKGVASGYAPLGGFAAREDLVTAFEEAGVDFNTIFTYSAQPMACAAGVAVQDILRDEGLIARAEQQGRRLGEALAPLRDLPIVGDVRGAGLLWGIEFVEDRDTKAPFPAERKLTADLLARCFRRGLLVYPGARKDDQGRGDQLVIAPPFIITDDEVDRLAGILDEAIRECCAAG